MVMCIRRSVITYACSQDVLIQVCGARGPLSTAKLFRAERPGRALHRIQRMI
jgi:hypothetical protein